MEQIIKNSSCKYIVVDNTICNIDLKDEVLYLIYKLNSNHSVNINISGNCTLVEMSEVNNKSNVTTNININRNSNVHLVNLFINDNEFERVVNTNVEENSYIEVDELFINNNKYNHKANYYVNGKYVNLLINNSIIANSKNTNNYTSNVYHNDTDSLSNLITYAISKNESVLNVYTNGIIPQKMSKTSLNQKTKGIILDDLSQISANPILEIDEYDVVASHGASIGQIDDEDLYYLMSRGLTKEDSQRLIINGLIYPFIEKVDLKELKEFAIDMINKTL